MGGRVSREFSVAFAIYLTLPLQLSFLLYLRFNFLVVWNTSSVSNCYFMGMAREGYEAEFIFSFLMTAAF